MRSEQRDSKRVYTIHTVDQIPAAGDSSGVFSDGTPWRSVRTSDPGRYEVYFDPRLTVINAIGNGPTDSRVFYTITSVGPGVVLVATRLYDASLTNAAFDLAVIVLDTRL